MKNKIIIVTAFLAAMFALIGMAVAAIETPKAASGR